MILISKLFRPFVRSGKITDFVLKMLGIEPGTELP